MTTAAVAADDDNDAGDDDDDDDGSDETQTTINHCVGNEQPWAWQGRLWRRFGRRWRRRAVVIVPVAVETKTMTRGGRSRTCRTPTRTHCFATVGGQRGERATSTTAATTNTSTGVFGVRVGRIPGTGDGGIHSAMEQRQRGRGGRIASHPADDGDARAGGGAAFRRRRTEEGEGDVDDGGDDEHVPSYHYHMPSYPEKLIT